MPKRLPEKITVRLSPDVYSFVVNQAAAEGITPTEKARNLIENQVRIGQAMSGLPVIEKVLSNLLSTYEERMTELMVHSATAAGTSAWLSRAILFTLNKEFRIMDPEDPKKENVLPTQPAWDQAVLNAQENVRRLRMQTRDGEDQ